MADKDGTMSHEFPCLLIVERQQGFRVLNESSVKQRNRYIGDLMAAAYYPWSC